MEAAGPGVGGSDPPGDLRAGWVQEDVAAEFPQVALLFTTVRASSGRSPRGVRQRLHGLSDRLRGAQAIVMRQAPIPWAYRVFYRHIGIDPDAQRTPIEAAVLERLLRGGFKSRSLLDDALTIALVETGVPFWALDSEAVEGRLGLRAAGADETLGRSPQALPVPPGRLVVADQRTPLAVLFGDVAEGHGVTRHTEHMTLFTVRVTGVPQIHVEEAMFTCLEILQSR